MIIIIKDWEVAIEVIKESLYALMAMVCIFTISALVILISVLCGAPIYP